MSARAPLRVGLTGGIASGKSSAGAMFAALGTPLIDADQVARAVVEPGESCLQAIIGTFGDHVLTADGRLDRAALRAIVFQDSAALKALEAITHPEIAKRIQQWLDRQTAPYVILESPLLLETAQHQWVKRVLVVDVDESVQIERATRRDGAEAEQVRAIIASQMPRSLRLSRANDIIRNDGDLAFLESQVRQLHRKYLEISQG